MKAIPLTVSGKQIGQFLPRCTRTIPGASEDNPCIFARLFNPGVIVTGTWNLFFSRDFRYFYMFIYTFFGSSAQETAEMDGKSDSLHVQYLLAEKSVEGAVLSFGFFSFARFGWISV